MECSSWELLIALIRGGLLIRSVCRLGIGFLLGLIRAQFPVRMVVCFPIPVFPDIVGIDKGFGRNDKCNQVYRTGKRAANAVHDTCKQSRGKSIADSFLVSS